MACSLLQYASKSLGRPRCGSRTAVNSSAVLPLLGALTLTACASGGSAAESPRQAITEYADALADGRLQDAYNLLSTDAKRQVDFATFQRTVREHPREVEELSQALRGPSQEQEVTAEVIGPGGETLTLFYEDGGWKVDARALDLYSQATPASAVSAFVRAYENRRYDVLLRFVPAERLEGLSAEKLKQAWEGEQKPEMDQLTQALKASLATAKFERFGERATMSYGAGGTVELRLERDAWKIEEF